MVSCNLPENCGNTGRCVARVRGWNIHLGSYNYKCVTVASFNIAPPLIILITVTIEQISVCFSGAARPRPGPGPLYNEGSSWRICLLTKLSWCQETVKSGQTDIIYWHFSTTENKSRNYVNIFSESGIFFERVKYFYWCSILTFRVNNSDNLCSWSQVIL